VVARIVTASAPTMVPRVEVDSAITQMIDFCPPND